MLMSSSSRRFTLKFSPVSVETLIETVEAVAAHPDGSLDSVARFAGLGRSTVGKAIPLLVAFGLVASDGPKLRCTEPSIGRGVADAVVRQALRRALIAYRPFEVVCEGLALGESATEAIRKASVILGIEKSDLDRFDFLIKLGVDLSLLREADGVVELAPEVTPAATAHGPFITSDDVESEVKSRLYVAGRMGREAFNALDDRERGLFASSLLSITGKPSETVEQAGQATENYLRELCGKRGLAAEAAKQNGAGQLASLLASKSIIHNHHVKLIDMVGALRNAKVHHKDKKTLVPWQITEEGALASFFAAVTAIKSIESYLKTGSQIL
jgi:hypothetical protein